jgi:hypothetical protein
MSEATVVAERRQNTNLRSIFDEACQLVAPFLDPEKAWGGAPMERLAYNALRDRYPDLSPEEVRVLVIAAARVFVNPLSEPANRLPQMPKSAIGACFSAKVA